MGPPKSSPERARLFPVPLISLATFGLGAACASALHILRRLRPKGQAGQQHGAADAQPSELHADSSSDDTSPAHIGASLKYVHPPHAAWTPGQPQPHPFPTDEMVEFDPSTIDNAALYSLIISAVIPRPIGFISSVGQDGKHNLAPYSYFNAMGHNPPIVALGCCRHGGRPAVDGEPAKKDTLANIEETGEFVVNIISDWYVEAANFTCGDFERGVDEMAAAGLTPLASVKVRPPRVAEAAIQMECKLRQVIEFCGKNGAPSSSVVLGEIVMVHVNKGATERSPTGKVVVDPLKLRPISRLGGLTYAGISELFELPRPNKDGSMPPLKTHAEVEDERRRGLKAGAGGIGK